MLLPMSCGSYNSRHLVTPRYFIIICYFPCQESARTFLQSNCMEASVCLYHQCDRKYIFIIYKVVKYRKILLIYNVYFIFSLVKI